MEAVRKHSAASCALVLSLGTHPTHSPVNHSISQVTHCTLRYSWSLIKEPFLPLPLSLPTSQRMFLPLEIQTVAGEEVVLYSVSTRT